MEIYDFESNHERKLASVTSAYDSLFQNYPQPDNHQYKLVIFPAGFKPFTVCPRKSNHERKL